MTGQTEEFKKGYVAAYEEFYEKRYELGKEEEQE